MTRDEILAAFDRIRVWQQGDRRAVHKPLLVLLALGRLLRGESPLVEFAGIEDQLGKLLEEFGPSGSERTRRNPFWHLRTDGVWQLAGPIEITNRPAGATPTITELRQGHVSGGFAEPVRLAPTTWRNCDGRSARGRATYNTRLLNCSRSAAAIPRFGRRCCSPTNTAAASVGTICALAATNGWQRLGLEAAHIKWFQAPTWRAGRGAKRPRAVFAAPQDLRPRRVHRAAGEPPDRVQPPPPR